MKAYLKKIEWRLRLPREIRRRVMEDLTCSIEERREAGQTDEEIMEELGSPRKAAAELNEQMREYTFRKSPWRFLCLAASLLSGGWLAWYWGITALFRGITFGESNSLGIIGGADGPTAIFVSVPIQSGIDWDIVLMAAILLAGLAGFFLLRRLPRKKA